MSDNKYASKHEILVRQLQKTIKHLRTAQFSHGHWEDGNWAANEAAQLIEDAIKASSEENKEKE